MIEIARGVPVVPVEEGYRDHLISVPTPPAGSEISWQLHHDAQIRAFHARLVASSQVANRVLVIQILSGEGAVLYEMVANTTVTAGNQGPINCAPSISTLTVSGYSQIALPEMWLRKGSIITTKTTGLQTGDTWTAGQAVLRMHHKSVNI